DATEEAAKQARLEAAQRAENALRLRVIFQSIGTMFLAAAVIATLFTWWTPNTFLSSESINRLSEALATQTAPAVDFLPTLTPMGGAVQPTAGVVQSAVGIVSGHKGVNPTTGKPDPGAVCSDGTTEQQTVEKIAT